MSDKELAVESNKDVATTQEVVSDASTMLGMVGKMASSQDCDIDKVERLMELQFKMRDKENEAAFNRAMSSAQSEMGVIVKNKWNDQTKSSYADSGAVIEAITPVYTRHEISLSFTSGSAVDGVIPITCFVSACGHTRTYNYDSPITDKGIKGTTMMTQAHARGSAISYGTRYLTGMIFNLATVDDDGNRATPVAKLITQEQENEIHAYITENGKKDRTMTYLAKMGINSLSEIPAGKFAGIMKTIKAGDK